MRKYLLILVLIVAGAFNIQAQTSVKGYSRLQKNEYDKAYDYFREALLENDMDIVGNYGMALLFSNNTFAKYNCFKAFSYIRSAQDNLKKANDRDLADLNKAVPDIKDKISKDYGEIEQKLFNIIKGNVSIADAEKFVNEFPDSKYLQEVIQIRNKEIFDEVRKTDIVASYDNFIERFPQATEIPDAIRLRDQKAYQDLVKSQNKLPGTYDYLQHYPKSELIERVMAMRDSLEFLKAVELNTAESYSAFIQLFPKSRQIDKAIRSNIQKHYEKAQGRNSIKDYQDFLNRYLYSEQGEGALTLRDNLQFEEIKETNTVDSYNKYITWAPNSTKKKEALTLRDKKAFSDAMEVKTIEALEDFIYKYPAASQMKEAATMRDTLVLKQCAMLTSPSLFNTYMKPYPTLAQTPKAQEIIEKLTLKEAEISPNQKEGYINFIEKYPASPLKKVAEERLKKLN